MDIPKYLFPEGQGTRGYAVLIANETFNKNFSMRRGASKDLEYMKQIAKALGLVQHNIGMDKNLNKDQMNKVIDDAAKKVNYTCEMFLFMISTHGDEQANTRKSGLIDHALMSIDEEVIFVSDLLEKFNDKYCPHLAGKPKLFFFQACRVIDHFLYMEHHSEMQMDDESGNLSGGQLKLSKDKDKIDWTSHEQNKQSFSEYVSSITRVESYRTTDGLKKNQFVIALADGRRKCFTLETDSAVNYWVVGLTKLTANIFKGKSMKFFKIANGHETSGTLSIEKRQLKWKTDAGLEGTVQIQAIRAQNSKFPQNANKFEADRCFSVQTNTQQLLHFAGEDGVSKEEIQTWIKTIIYTIHENKIGVDEGISVKVADTDTGTQGVTVLPYYTEGDNMDFTESDSKGDPDSWRHAIADTKDPELPPIPKIESPAKQLPVNLYPRESLPFHPHALAPVFKCYNDMLIMTSSPSGMKAWRSSSGKKAGSWMIRFIKEELEKSKESDIFLTKVLTKVAYDMANIATNCPTTNPVHHGMKNVCVIDHQLLKALIFCKCA